MKYVWTNSRYSVDAAVVGEKVESLAAANDGVCPPSALVEAARSKRSKIHDLFTWDNDTAADNWRRHEARKVINSIRVVVEDRPEPVPAFVHVRVLNDDTVREGYASSVTVAADPQMSQFAIQEALSALNGWRRRYGHVSELRPVLDAIDEATKAVAS